jgi:hypothetical protein
MLEAFQKLTTEGVEVTVYSQDTDQEDSVRMHYLFTANSHYQPTASCASAVGYGRNTMTNGGMLW